jgi:hypothetical protein
VNKAEAIIHLYPTAKPVKDFNVYDDGDGKGQYIAVWDVKDEAGNPVPQPTEAELAAAWEELQSLPPKPIDPTSEERIAQLEAEKADLVARQEASESAILTLMDVIMGGA